MQKRVDIWKGHVYSATFKVDNPQGPSVQYMEICPSYVAAWMGGQFGEWIHVYEWMSPALHLKLSQHC